MVMKVADPLHSLSQDVVGDPERVDHRRRAVEHLEQPVVRDDDHGVAGGAKRLHARVGRGPRLDPSNRNGVVTMPTVSAPSSRAMRATTGPRRCRYRLPHLR